MDRADHSGGGLNGENVNVNMGAWDALFPAPPPTRLGRMNAWCINWLQTHAAVNVALSIFTAIVAGYQVLHVRSIQPIYVAGAYALGVVVGVVVSFHLTKEKAARDYRRGLEKWVHENFEGPEPKP